MDGRMALPHSTEQMLVSHANHHQKSGYLPGVSVAEQLECSPLSQSDEGAVQACHWELPLDACAGKQPGRELSLEVLTAVPTCPAVGFLEKYFHGTLRG